MKVIKIDKGKWESGLEALKKSYTLLGPKNLNHSFEFKVLEANEAPDLTGLNTRLSAKGLVYPQSQAMFTYTLDEKDADHHIMKPLDKKPSKRAVIGIRPCDADAFLLVKRNFDTPEYRDPYWIEAYEATVLIGLACTDPCGTCFCTTAGSGPASEKGLDVILLDKKDYFIAKPITAKGEAFLSASSWTEEMNASQAEKDLQEAGSAAEKKITSFIHTENLRDKVSMEIYNAPFWEDVSFSCINCGTCTFVCPTCWCFDIQDETHKNKGVRMRNWDSCMFPLFTLHGSGHNPRGEKVHRVRQRFMHKLKYYVDKYENGIQCVGCGRCVRSCPVNIDIRRVCELMNHPENATCAAQ
ncbi:MAG: 4Fe-4S dicluster domain-containing protein [Proteobacteria bacterium]|nr:4Fe-4S dicluster domain-containing protein [Pseudomonadota bacterium]MBU4471330.1 4Fe-4S dicluster domain-containing protein [Pseudomonadota bacterium]MCG2751667.1 4Fe-4S dicluster domain-containing protein [Desulfobacteraceae bacterium]